MKHLCTLFLLVIGLSGYGVEKYVVPHGTGDGTSWDKAGGINLVNSLGGGDTLWLAGGDYGNGFGVTAAGTAAAPIRIVKASESAHGSAAGWSSALGGQAVFSSGITLGGKYVVLDGGEWAPPGLPAKFGIRITTANGSKGVDMQVGNTTLRDVEVIGPGYNQCSIETDLVHFGSGSLVSGCSLHDSDVGGFAWVGTTGSTIEYSFIYNLGAKSGGPHPDICYSAGGWQSGTFRWNVIANIVSEGVFFDNQAKGSDMLFLGNLWLQGNSRGYGCVPIEYQNNASYGTVFLYGNTFVDWWKSNNLGGNTASLGAGSLFKNNLFVNTNSEWPAAGMSHNGFFGVAGRGANPVVGTVSPFVGPWVSGSGIPPATHVYPDGEAPTMPGYNPAQYVANFALATNSWAVGKADISVPAEYRTDLYGHVGVDLGAFQGIGGSGGTPAPSPSATPPVPSPSPSATPAPTPPAGESKFKVGESVVTVSAETNIRETPSGTILGTQPAGIKGTILAGPEMVDLKTMVAWYDVNFASGADGWCGDDNLEISAAPVPTPTPAPTPPVTGPTYNQWAHEFNQAQADWVRAHPPVPDQ